LVVKNLREWKEMNTLLPRNVTINFFLIRSLPSLKITPSGDRSYCDYLKSPAQHNCGLKPFKVDALFSIIDRLLPKKVAHQHSYE